MQGEGTRFKIYKDKEKDQVQGIQGAGSRLKIYKE